jgi:hypothetical protein
MYVKRCAYVFVVLFILFLSAISATAQTAVNYRFLEVVDTTGKPVANATAKTEYSSQQTDEKGNVKVPVYYGDFNTRSVTLSKAGYFEYTEFLSYRSESPLLRGENPQYDPDGPMKIVLLKMPATEAERKVVEVEQQKRELFLAVRRADAASVRKLLQAGADANSKDLDGVPIILWAATIGELETIKALLAAGADVRSKDKTGRKALFYYLLYHYNYPNTLNEEVVRSLLAAGADVNASDGRDTNTLVLAKQTGNASIIKLVESAATQHK